MSNELIGIIGFAVSFLLSVNGYLFRGMVNTLNDIKISLVKLTNDHEHSTVLVRKHEEEIDTIKERLHILEGKEASMKRFIELMEQGNINGN